MPFWKNSALRPQINLQSLRTMNPAFDRFLEKYDRLPFAQELLEEVEVSMKYSSYIQKEEENVARLSKYDSLPLRSDFDYKSILSISYEAREKLSRLKPATLGQASRIPGVSPSDISVLLIWLNKG